MDVIEDQYLLQARPHVPNLAVCVSLIAPVIQLPAFCRSITQRVLLLLALLTFLLYYRGKHQAHSYYKSKKVLDNTGAQVKSSVYVNGVSNRRGVWRVNYEAVVVFR
jgi:hypothetical protein